MAEVYQKLDLDQTDVLINGRQTVTITSLEWDKGWKTANTYRGGKLVSTASVVESKTGRITLEQCEKLLIAEELGSGDGTLSGLVCNITAVDRVGRKTEIKEARFGQDSYKVGAKAPEDTTTVEFEVLGDVRMASK